MNDKHLLNPLRLFRALEMWLWYGRGWGVSLPYMLRYHHRPFATARYLESKRKQALPDLTRLNHALGLDDPDGPTLTWDDDLESKRSQTDDRD